jgi:hypothetical protein
VTRARHAAGLPAIDIILLFAAAEADLPKLEEARHSHTHARTHMQHARSRSMMR